ncbi:MAG TPA: fumarylacetoacetase [Cytophagales bacterium]|nr:fumarylacetoacetase [Cytophagales bacterium]HAA21161.1 fumarylacetoacetase [Cytophagales bacterium]HAP60681.1 fumarylacetoacetase [Cytophagales bacterium]
MIHANDPSLTSWIPVAPDSDFPIQNLPYGIFKPSNRAPRVGVAIGDFVLDLHVLQETGYFEGFKLPFQIFRRPFLNDFMALGKQKTNRVRERISEILREDNHELRENKIVRHRAVIPMEEVEMQMPVFARDYTDFYSSIEHATNVGKMFRDPDNALLPNWKHIPVGYHGRASSIVLSGTSIKRPSGQTKADTADAPTFGPSKLLDFELEMAFVTNVATPMGDSISTTHAETFIFGMVLFNDWSARDIQKWEYVPLGPFLGKNFASSISPWVVPLEALEPFRVGGPKQDPEPLPYLKQEGPKNFDINLEVAIQPNDGEEHTVCRSNFKHMYWSMSQQLAHHTVNGCNINPGDLYGSGTISGPTPDSYGSMLELSWRGTKPITLPDGSTRKFIEDYDTVVMRGYCKNDNYRIGFGEVRTQVLPAYL